MAAKTKKRVKGTKAVKGRAKATAVPVPAKGALIATLPNVTRARFTANGAAVLLARLGKKTVSLFDIDTGTETPALKLPLPFSAVALSTDSRFLALGTDNGIIAMQSTQTGKLLWKTKKPLKADAHAVTDITITHDGSLVVAGGPTWLRIFDAKTGATLSGPGFDPIAGAACPHLALSPDGLFLAHSETHSNSALVWHIPTRQVAHFIKLPVPKGPIVRLAFGLTVRQLFVAQAKGISTWNGETGQEILQFDIEGAESMAVLDHANVLAVVRPGAEKAAPQLDLWSAPTGRLRRSIALPEAEFGPLTASPDGGRLALPAGKVCYVWDSGKLIP